MQQISFSTDQIIIGIKPLPIKRKLALEYQFAFLRFTIYYYEDTDLYQATIKNDNEYYEPSNFSLESHYRESIIQDCLYEINSPKFLEIFELETFVEFKSFLVRVLQYT